jgi:hypothetical protein
VQPKTLDREWTPRVLGVSGSVSREQKGLQPVIIGNCELIQRCCFLVSVGPVENKPAKTIGHARSAIGAASGVIKRQLPIKERRTYGGPASSRWS